MQLDEERFNDPIARQPGRGAPEAKELMGVVRDFIAATPAEQVYREAQAIDQAWGVVRAPDETISDPHWADRGFFVEAPIPGRTGEQAVMPGAPYTLSATPWSLRRAAPALGADSAEILGKP
jgi:benzylsuccinate CoA-transferase BbsE subunit